MRSRFTIEECAKIEADEHHLGPVEARRVAEEHLRERADYYDGLAVIEKAPPGYYFHVPDSHWLQVRIAVVVALLLTVFITASWLGGEGSLPAVLMSGYLLYAMGWPYISAMLST